MKDADIEKHDDNKTDNTHTGTDLVVSRVSISSTETSEGVIPPDGGWGWVVCFACFMSHALVDGLFYSFGVVYVELLDYFKGSKGETAIIASLTPGVCFLVGPVVAVVVNKYGCRVVVVAGTFLSSGSLIVSIFAPNIQFLYFSLGAMLGVGYGMIFLPSIVSVSHYFEKRRALATGIGVSGAGIGTFIFSPLTSLLIETYSWQGAILIQAGFVLNCLACGLVYRPIKLAKPSEDETSQPIKSTLTNTSDNENHQPIILTDPSQEGTYIPIEVPDTLDSTNHEDNISNSCNDHLDNTKSKSRIDNSCSVSNTIINQPELSAICCQEDINDDECKINRDSIDKCDKGDNDSCKISTDERKDNYFDKSKYLSAGCENKSDWDSTCNDALLSKPVNQPTSKQSVEDLGIIQQLKQEIKGSFSVEIFRNIPFCMFLISTFFYSLGYYVPYVYLPDTAREAGVDDFRASLLISTIGITNTVGRVLFWFLSDQKWMNRLVLYASALVICGIGTCFGPLLMTFELLLVYSIIFGVFSGVTISLTSVILSDIVGIHKLADAFGVTNFFGGIGSFLGPPLAGWLYDLTGDYVVSYIVAGVAIVFSGAMLYFVPCIDGKLSKKIS